MAIYFFKKICFILETLGTFGTLHLSLCILLKSWNDSRDLRDLICLAIYFFKKTCFTGFRDLRDFGDLISISLDLTKNLEPFLGPSGPYIYGFFFFFLKKLWESRDLRDFRNLICISLDLTKKIEQFSGIWGPYMYGCPFS